MPHLKCEASKIDSRAESHTGPKYDSHQHIAAVLCASKTLVGAVPSPIRAPNAFWFPDDIIPHHLKNRNLKWVLN